MSTIDNSTRKNQLAELNDLQSEHSRKKRQLIKEQEAELADLKDYYGEKRATLAEQNEAAINHIRKNQKSIHEGAVTERQKLSENYNSKTAMMQKNYDERLAQMRDKRESQISTAQQESKLKVNEIESQAAQKIQHIRDQSNQEQLKEKQRYNEDMARLNEFASIRLERQREANNAVLAHEVERGHNAQERLRSKSEKEYLKIKTAGEQRVVSEQDKQTWNLEKVNEAAAKNHEALLSQWESKEESLNSRFSEKLQHTKKIQNEQLKDQQHRFVSTFQKNEEAQRESYGIQQKNYAKQLAKTKKDFIRSAEKYAEKSQDPFYKVEDRGSSLSEDPNFYILKTFVPEHEKDNVKVTVQNNKATVSGQRSFKDRIEDQGKTLSSSSFQSFREEFSFEKPVVAEGMTRERDGDWITYHIPKRN